MSENKTCECGASMYPNTVGGWFCLDCFKFPTEPIEKPKAKQKKRQWIDGLKVCGNCIWWATDYEYMQRYGYDSRCHNKKSNHYGRRKNNTTIAPHGCFKPGRNNGSTNT